MLFIVYIIPFQPKKFKALASHSLIVESQLKTLLNMYSGRLPNNITSAIINTKNKKFFILKPFTQ